MSNSYDGSETVMLPNAPPSPGGEATLTFSGQGPRPELGNSQLPVIEGYEIQKELGRGGMGVVYLARQTTLNREVALKMVIAGGQASTEERTRFFAEAELAAGLRHPGIVQIHEFGTFGGQPFFALEYCPNGSLASQLNGHPMAAIPAAKLIVRLADAIDVAHQNGIVHRDLKPGNVLLAEDGSPKITDFGLARRGDSSKGLTATGAILGTPGYMAPEQADGKSSLIGPSTDVYALGSILYECLTGRPPFRAATAIDTVMQVVREEPVPPSKLSPKIPRDLETICLKCLRKDPAKRYTLASALAGDLRRFLNGEPITARPVSRIERAWKMLKRHPAISGGAFTVTMALIAVTLVVAVKNRQLGRERDNALRSQLEATAEQQKNQRLVEVAIEQQERLIARITGVDWTGNRALVAEREKLLQDVAEFYNQLLREEVDDPIVRRKNAEAHVRLAMLKIHRSEYSAAAESIRLAKQSLDFLTPDSNDSDSLTILAKAESAAGHLAALLGDLPEGAKHYHQAAELAERVVVLHPDREESKMQLMECYLSLVQYYGQSDAAKSIEYGDKIIALGEGVPPEHGNHYQSRLLRLAALSQKSQSLARKGEFKKSLDVMNEASKIAERLSREEAPSVRNREITEQYAASLSSSRGLLRLQFDKSPEAKKEAIKQMQESVARFDRVLAGNPKSIPFQLQRFNTLMQYAIVQDRVGDAAGALKTHQELDKSVRSMLADHPKLTWLNDIVAVSRSVLLVNQATEDRMNDFEANADLILKLKESPGPLMSSAKYNVACAYSLASLKADEKNREKYQLKAVEILDLIRVGGYFSLPSRVEELKKDADFEPIRKREDFKIVLNKIAGGK